MKELYLANMWPQIVTEKGTRLLEKQGYITTGNWLDDNYNYSSADKIVHPYANFGQSVVITEENPKLWKKVVSYILFPDSLLGWDIENKKYLFKKNNDAEQLLINSSKCLSHSNYSSQLVSNTYENMQNIILPLGVDTDSIKNSSTETHKGLRVVWNHMWRSDKGTYEAFNIISDLAPKYPNVEFWIGQANTWSNRDSDSYKQECNSKLKILYDIVNVRFFNRITNQEKYWAWLKHTDIGFSTSFQEGFGLSMMEQEAAGIACVVPNEEAYPELHAGCLILNRSQLTQGIMSLIENPIERKSLSQSCLENASKYDTSTWVNLLADYLK